MNADGAFTFGSPQADAGGLVNQLTVSGSFGLSSLTVTNPTTGATATVGLDNGSATTLQEGHNAATGAPNEQAMTTAPTGQTNDSVFGQGATVPAGAATFVSLVGDGTSATVDGAAFVGLHASNQDVTLGASGIVVGTDSDLHNIGVQGDGYTLQLGNGVIGTFSGSNVNATLGLADSGNFSGNGDTLDYTANSGDSFSLDGQNFTVNNDSGYSGVQLYGDGTARRRSTRRPRRRPPTNRRARPGSRPMSPWCRSTRGAFGPSMAMHNWSRARR